MSGPRAPSRSGDVVVAGAARDVPPAPELSAAAGLVQLGDAGLGVWQRNLPMAVLPAVLGVFHLASARLLGRNEQVG